MRDTKIQWHPGFAAAMGLELAENRDDLIIQKEFNLNTKPLEIDLLVIKKNSDIRIDNEIGHIFKGNNIMEYKSPEDHLNIDTFYKAAAYACLYKSCGAKVDAIKADDITVSLVRDIRPLGLLQYLKKQGFLITNPYRGIYYIEGKVLFPTQIVVTRELGEDIHIWLRALSEKISMQEMEALVEKVRELEGKLNRELADSVLEVSIQANERRMEEWKGEGNMGPALMRVMKTELEVFKKEAIQKGMEKGMQEGLQEGMKQGIQEGMQQGLQEGMKQGIQEGMKQGIQEGMQQGLQEGMKQGIQEGMQQGLQEGMQQGMQQGMQKSIEILQDLGYESGKIARIVKEKYNLTDEEIRRYIDEK